MNALGLLAALALGISHSPAPPQNCAYVVSMIAVQPGPVMAGSMRTTDGGCIVWANLAYASALRKKDACQLAAHELGHLNGLQHSPDPNALMHSPFRPLKHSYC